MSSRGYLVVWSEVVTAETIEDAVSEAVCRFDTNRGTETMTWHVREILDTVDEEGCNDLGPIQEVYWR